uniref:FYVE-type domain-containing protein n=2 Tax=Neobodo designis TaxID=312471 RepID=A0A7S1Q3H6_NEODS|mmetsp:Transcript_31705/g.98066  ORF Transcript_31705/g.98066 Transcript_31705/m.98066 type:complete len:628 (+) Transcript_31705:234-2117(+)
MPYCASDMTNDNNKHHNDDDGVSPPAPAAVAEAAGLLLRDAYVDAARTVDPLLRHVQKAHESGNRSGRLLDKPVDQQHNHSNNASANNHRAAAASFDARHVSDDDAAAAFVIAGFAHLFAMVDPKWARSIAVQLTDRYPLFPIGVVLRAEAEAASGDFPAAYNLLSRVERDLTMFDDDTGVTEPRSIYKALAPPSNAGSSVQSPQTRSPPNISAGRFSCGDSTDDDTDPAPLGFMGTTSAAFIRAIWLHVAARRLSSEPEDGATASSKPGSPQGLRRSSSMRGAGAGGAIASLSTGRLSGNAESGDVELLTRYVAAARQQLQQQEANWLRYRAVLDFARHVGASVHPCSKCGRTPGSGGTVTAPPPQWRCSRCAAASKRPFSAHSSPSQANGGSSIATSSTGGGVPRRPSGAFAPPLTHLGEPHLPPVPPSAPGGTPRSPAGSFAFYRQHVVAGDGEATTPNGAAARQHTTTLTGPPTPHAGFAGGGNCGNGSLSLSGSFSESPSAASMTGSGSWRPSGSGASKSAGMVWAPDNTNACQRCAKSVGRLTRHHCRSCGRLVCAACSSQRREVPLLGFYEPVRVCANCADVLDSTESQRNLAAAMAPGLGPRGSKETFGSDDGSPRFGE